MILIDAGYLTARSRYIFGDLQTTQGAKTGAVYGFLKTIQQIKKNYPKQPIVVCLDSYCEWRAKLLGNYKSKRESHQEGYLGSEKQLQHAFEKGAINHVASAIPNVRVVTSRDSEADDLIAYYASISKPEDETIIFSADKDMWQLVTYPVKITNKINAGNFVIADKPKDFIDIPIESLALYRAMMGDSSDEIPKIKGLKSKEIIAICNKVHTLEEFIEETDNLLEYKSTEVLVQNFDQLKINYEVCRLPTTHLGEIVEIKSDRERAIATLECLQLNSLRRVID